MPSGIQKFPKAWLVGSGIEPLAAAFYLIDQAELSGAQIRVLDTDFHIKADSSGASDIVGDRLFSEDSPSLCQDHCLHQLLSKIRAQLWKDHDQPPGYPKGQDLLIQQHTRRKSLSKHIAALRVRVRNLLSLILILNLELG
jgi:hypothetical protein